MMRDPEGKGGGKSKEYYARLAEGSGNVDESGNFSIQVLETALHPYDLKLPNIAQQHLRNVEVTSHEGFICNRSNHWFTIRLINGQYWNLNSTQERPKKISHFHLAAEIQAIQAGGYSVFTPVGCQLPPSCTSSKDRDRGLPQYWWKETDLINDVGDRAVTGETDPWANVGSGMRLDGSSSCGSGSTGFMSQESKGSDFGEFEGEDVNLQAAILASRGGGGGGGNGGGGRIESLTEDEMLQMAIDASMAGSVGESNESLATTEVGKEPGEGEAGVVKLQIRLPNNKRVVRRFRSQDMVEVIYSYVKQEDSSGGSKRLELRAFFPPKSIDSLRGMDIGGSGLAGESLSGRWG